MMTFEDYLFYVRSLTNWDMTEKELWARDALKLVTEAAEVADRIEKHIFQGHPLNTDKVLEELGDLEYYRTHLLGLLGKTDIDVREANVKKLKQRYPTGRFTPADSIARVDTRPAENPTELIIDSPPLASGQGIEFNAVWVDDGHGQGYFVSADSPRLQNLPEEATPHFPVQEVSTKPLLPHNSEVMDWSSPPNASPIADILAVRFQTKPLNELYYASSFEELKNSGGTKVQRFIPPEEFEELPNEGEDIED